GLLHKVAVGYYVVVPQDRAGTDWRPTIEAAAAGIATAAVGAGSAILMGLSAARLHHAISRALGTGIVAVSQHRQDDLIFFGGTALSRNRTALPRRPASHSARTDQARLRRLEIGGLARPPRRP
ncbi:MAG TPA: hypothetical protein VLL08_07540, partial [Kineosporiaceae bacterium]|nr:hypothetical protein [Kineosporiaceae bacterium]